MEEDPYSSTLWCVIVTVATPLRNWKVLMGSFPFQQAGIFRRRSSFLEMAAILLSSIRLFFSKCRNLQLGKRLKWTLPRMAAISTKIDLHRTNPARWKGKKTSYPFSFLWEHFPDSEHTTIYCNRLYIHLNGCHSHKSWPISSKFCTGANIGSYIKQH